ncbi:MAG: hypothetical protein JW871_04605 [Endomicrobiales bacterium]|nr:hypothetical protein [Endomicrobiales bacterium]
MRLWSIHPKYLDCKGLVALWRESLLAKKVLQDRTRGYKNHPQLIRFRRQSSPLTSINIYLKEILKEAKNRGYSFDIKKTGPTMKRINKIPVTCGQIKFEFTHLLKKLKKRDRASWRLLKSTCRIKTHPLFKKVPGKIEEWEK